MYTGTDTSKKLMCDENDNFLKKTILPVNFLPIFAFGTNVVIKQNFDFCK